MEAWMIGGVGFAIGAALAGAATALHFLARRGPMLRDLGEAEARGAHLAERVETLERERTEASTALDVAQRAREEAERTAATATEQARAARAQVDEREALMAQVKGQLGDAFAAVGARTLQANSEQFLALAKKSFDTLLVEAKGDSEQRRQAVETLVKPIREMLERQHKAVTDLEAKREGAFKGIEEQIRAIGAAHERLSSETNRLVTALRRPEQRGRWGEMQLRNAVEMAGMTAHCDFVEQPPLSDDDRSLRPDMIVKLPGGGSIIVDAKVALDAYLASLDPDADRDAALQRHAKQVDKHMRTLASKQYWKALDRTPHVVVMFMPLETALTAAMEVNPDLHAEAMRNHVLIATPTLLVAVLRAVAFGWQQEDVAAHAREIARAGTLVYERLGKFVETFEKVGANLRTATTSYNKAVGTLEARLLPSVRRIGELNAPHGTELSAPAPIDVDVREIAAAELKPSAEPATDAPDAALATAIAEDGPGEGANEGMTTGAT